MAVVKANAYGHGMSEVARALSGVAEMFGVADVGEARRLRETLPDARVFILGAALPHERAEIARHGFVPTVSSPEEAAAFAQLAGENTIPIHVDIDTGMGRI